MVKGEGKDLWVRRTRLGSRDFIGFILMVTWWGQVKQHPHFTDDDIETDHLNNLSKVTEMGNSITGFCRSADRAGP